MSEEQVIDLSMEAGIATITLRREKQLNALNKTVLEELKNIVDSVKDNHDVRVVILQGAGRAFAAGADIAWMSTMDPVSAAAFAKLGQDAFTALERLPQPTIALVHGFALGGGMELSMACDIRLAAEGTKFGQPEVTLGVIPGFGGSQRLPRIVGQGNALRLLLGGDLIDATEAHRIGLVTEVVPAEALATKGQELAEKLARLAPKALGWVKDAVYDGAELDQVRGLTLEANLFGLCFATADQKEGMGAFLEKRKPSFDGA